MSIKDLLVAFDGTAASEAALHMGALLSRKNGARLSGLLAHGAAADYPASAAWIDANTRAVMKAASDAALKQVRDRFSALASREGLEDATWLEEQGRPDLVVAEFAKFYDLTLLGQFGSDASEARFILHPDRIALKAGRPLLVVPAAYSDAKNLQDHVLVAWDGGRGAARALSDAMSLLQNQALVTLATVGDRAQPSRGRDIEAHLANHGIRTEWVRLPADGNTGNALMEFAGKIEPDMMVMGAYEHSKFREDFFGGVTDTVLRHTRVPVLISH